MKKALLAIHPAFTVGEIDPRMYGVFLENLGRSVYGGVYDPEHPSADEDGFRQDVIALMREMGCSCVRFPGGNAVSAYRWEDSVGPKESRPTRLNVAFHSLEPHTFGLDEFVRWCRKIGAEPMLTFNLGTRGIEEAEALTEYCNFPGGTPMSDWRRSHGAAEPYNIKTWFLGNEMSGRWQMPGRDAADYAWVARESAKMVHSVSPGSELAICGPCGRFELLAPEDWLYQVLTRSYGFVEYVSVHRYLNNRITSAAFSPELEELDDYLAGVIAGCDYIAARQGNPRKMKICVDEWGVWRGIGTELRNGDKWECGAAKIEDSFSMSDALLSGGMLISLLSHADRVKLACISEAVNAIAPIRAEKNGKAWRQTIWHPFALTARHARGTVLRQQLDSDRFTASDGGRELPAYYGVTVWNREKHELVLIGLNRLMTEPLALEFRAEGMHLESVEEFQTMFHPDPEAVNSPEAESVSPTAGAGAAIAQGRLTVELPPASWNLIRLKITVG